jgi:hypothetical protein
VVKRPYPSAPGKAGAEANCALAVLKASRPKKTKDAICFIILKY